MEEKKEKLRELDALKLFSEKAKKVKELEKIQQKIAQINMNKASERGRIAKEVEGFKEVLMDIELIEAVWKEKDF